MKNNEVAEKYFFLAEINQQNENFAEALENFNKCLCNAAIGSSYIFTALVKRSNIYYEVKQYQKCLENLNWAQKIKVFDDDDKVLFEMAKCCEEAISLEPTRPISMDIFQLSSPVNPKVPFISDCLQLQENEIYGRYITTTKDLIPGDVIVAEEPFYKVLDGKVSQQRCAICCTVNMLSLIPCDNCSRAMFCSDKCKNSLIHKRECETFGKDGVNTLEEFLLQRMFYQGISVCGSMEQLKKLIESQTTEKTIMDFDFSNTNDAVNEKNFILAVTGLDKREPVSADTVIKFQKIRDRLMAETDGMDCSRSYLTNYLIRCLKSLTVNFFHFFWSASNDAKGEGFALCTLSAFFAHSCDPNVEKIDVDNKFIFIARKPIKAGEQLNMCYDRHNFTKYSLDERQRYLYDVYKFKCNCAACINDYPQYDFSITDIQGRSIKEVKEKYKLNCEFIEHNILSYPSKHICSIMEENVHLLNYIANSLPF